MKKILSIFTMLLMAFVLIGATPEKPEYPGIKFDFFDLQVMEERLEPLEYTLAPEEVLGPDLFELFADLGYEVRIYDNGEVPAELTTLFINADGEVAGINSIPLKDEFDEYLDTETFVNSDGLTLAEVDDTFPMVPGPHNAFFNEDRSIVATIGYLSGILILEDLEPEISEYLLGNLDLDY